MVMCVERWPACRVEGKGTLTSCRTCSLMTTGTDGRSDAAANDPAEPNLPFSLLCTHQNRRGQSPSMSPKERGRNLTDLAGLLRHDHPVISRSRKVSCSTSSLQQTMQNNSRPEKGGQSTSCTALLLMLAQLERIMFC